MTSHAQEFVLGNELRATILTTAAETAGRHDLTLGISTFAPDTSTPGRHRPHKFHPGRTSVTLAISSRVGAEPARHEAEGSDTGHGGRGAHGVLTSESGA